MPADVSAASPYPALEVRNLTVRYGSDAERPALSEVNLQVQAGEILGITGVGGSGKSTLAYALLGLAREPGQVTAGEVRIGGVDLLRMDDTQQRNIRGRDIALIVQNPRACLDPLARVGVQIGRVWSAHRDTNSAARTTRNELNEAVVLLRLVGINDPERRAQAFAHELSGGMAQRVLIAMALSGSPSVLIADEPTSGLDVTVQAQFLDLMWRNAKEQRLALVLITQEPGILANYCDRVLVMAGGRIAESLSVHEFFAPDRPTKVGVPATVRAGASRRPNSLVEVCNLVKDFPVEGGRGAVHAVGDISFKVFSGETLGLVGESGSGKTTVGRCLLGLDTPTSGSVAFRGETLGAQSARALREIRAKLQVVHQDPRDSLDPRWTIGRSVQEPLDLHTTFDGRAKRARVEQLLRWTGCDSGIANLKPRDLGNSELQRVNVARALATEPDFIVLDEPTSQLAPMTRDGLVDLLCRLQSERDLAYLFISHDLTTVRKICHRVAVMYLGQIVEMTTSEELFRFPKHPYTRALLSCHLEMDPARRRVDRPQPDGLSGEIPSPIDLPTGCYLASRCPQVEDACRHERQTLREVAPGHSVRCRRATS